MLTQSVESFMELITGCRCSEVYRVQDLWITVCECARKCVLGPMLPCEGGKAVTPLSSCVNTINRAHFD